MAFRFPTVLEDTTSNLFRSIVKGRINQSIPEQFANKFDVIQTSAELYLMTACVVAGVFMNGGALVLWIRKEKVYSMLRFLICSLIVSDQLYLVSLFPYLVCRPRGKESKYFDGSLEVGLNDSSLSEKHSEVVGRYHFVHYISIVLGACQCFSMWMLCLCSSEARSILRQVVSQSRDRNLSPAFSVVLFLFVAFYFSHFLPEVRQAIVKFSGRIDFMREFVHDPELMPVQNHWDFVLNEVKRNDVLYIVYFSFFYIFFTYLCPYVIVIAMDKGIIDELHMAQGIRKSASSTPAMLLRRKSTIRKKNTVEEMRCKSIEKSVLLARERKLTKRGMAADNRLIRDRYLYPCLVISVTCNVFLVCVALKMIILTFKLFEFLHSYVTGAYVFFKYLNVYSNFVQFLKAVVHLPSLMIYDYNTSRSTAKLIKRVRDGIVKKPRDVEISEL